jgi:hypothetical protein
MTGGIRNATIVFGSDAINQTDVNIGTKIIKQLQNSTDSLRRLDNAECLPAYGSDPHITSWGSLLLITSAQANISVTDFYQSSSPDRKPGYGNLDSGQPQYGAASGLSWARLSNGTIAAANSWSVNTSTEYPVEYCMAVSLQNKCLIRISTNLLLSVIISNLIKLLSMVAAVCTRSFQPLATIGDAVASFLEAPDAHTIDLGAMSSATGKKRAWRRLFTNATNGRFE